jgi:hypothetical protein
MKDNILITIIIILFVVTVTFLFGFTLMQIDKSRCSGFGQETNRNVKFVKYNLATWACLTEAKDGK